MKQSFIASTLLLALAASPAWADNHLSSAKAAAVTHQGSGKVLAIDRDKLKVKMEHNPIASLNWPGMTMDFKVARAELLEKMKPGAEIGFTLVQGDKPGRWVIDQVTVK